MKLTRRVATLMAASAFAASFTFGAAQAAEKLIISSWAPPTHGINAKLWPRFIEMIEKATEGRVTAEIKYKLASPPAFASCAR